MSREHFPGLFEKYAHRKAISLSLSYRLCTLFISAYELKKSLSLFSGRFILDPRLLLMIYSRQHAFHGLHIVSIFHISLA
jgi:hypothetical protein